MEIEELRRLRPALNRFVRQFDDCISTQPTRRHFRTYISGQLGPLERKSIEPIALDAKVRPRTLQEFLSIHRWDEKGVARRLREIVRRDHSDPSGIGVIDETSFAKKGTKTAVSLRGACMNSTDLPGIVSWPHYERRPAYDTRRPSPAHRGRHCATALRALALDPR